MPVKQLVQDASTPFERAIEATSGERWLDLDIDVIRRARDPETCPPHLLNFLAFDRSVDIWDANWPDWKKRSVIAAAPANHRKKGTLEGIRRYLTIADADLIEVVRPPEGFFASPDLTKEEWDRHIEKHPKVRITLARGEGEFQPPEGFLADVSFASADFQTFNDARALIGRRAILVQDGQERPLQLSEVRTGSEDRNGVVRERIVTPGENRGAFFSDDGAADIAFAGVFDKEPGFYTFELNRSYLHATSDLELTTVPIGLQPRDTRFYRESEEGQGGFAVFVGDFADDNFAEIDEGGKLLADVLYLHDPSIAAPQVEGMSFANVSRAGMDAHTAEMLIDWNEKIGEGDAFLAGHSFAGFDPATDSDTARRDFILDSIETSQRLSDRVRVTFQTTRSRTFGDGIPLDGRNLEAVEPNTL